MHWNTHQGQHIEINLILKLLDEAAQELACFLLPERSIYVSS